MSTIVSRIVKMSNSIQISELIVFIAFMPFFGINLAKNTTLNQIIYSAQKPVFTSITVHKNVRAISIAGTTEFPNQRIRIENAIQEEIIELTTDDGGKFIAVLGSSFQSSQPGKHEVLTTVKGSSTASPMIASERLGFTIDDNFLITLDEGDSDTVTLQYRDISREDIASLQTQYHLTLVTSPGFMPGLYREISYEHLIRFYTAFSRIIYGLVGAFALFAFTRRWQRKTASGKSFWSLGKGIYFSKANEPVSHPPSAGLHHT